MKASFKKLLMILVILVVAMAIIPATVGAESTVEIGGWNVALGDSIGVNFYLSVPAADVANTQVSINVEEKSITSAVSALDTYGDYYVCSASLPAAQMTENIQVVITTGDEEVVNKNYTICQYAATILQGEYTQETKDLVKHMLNYGATAQNYFGWNTGNLATAGITVPALKEVPNANLAITSQGSATDVGLRFGGCSMIHLDRVGIRFYFELNEDVSNYTFSGGTVGYSSKHGMHYAQFLDICPQYYNNVTTVTVTNQSGASVSYSYSPMHYITRMYHKSSSSAEMKNMMKALYNYHIAALEYVSEVSEATVYDIFDLTGAAYNTLKGTNDTWDGQIHASINAAHKENMAFKTKLTMGEQEMRLSLNAMENAAGADVYDPKGYAVYINHNGGNPYIVIMRNQKELVVSGVSSVIGTWELEAGIVDILLDGNRVGKRVYVKKDGVTVCSYNDYSGYLTGDALGTKVIDFHYGAATQMDTTYNIETVAAEVYDIYDLTGSSKTLVASWATTEIGTIASEHKEQAALSVGLNIKKDRDRYYFAVGAPAGADCSNPQGYGLQISSDVDGDGRSYVIFYRNGTGIMTFNDVSALLGDHTIEFGYRTINITSALTAKTTTLYKQVYLNVDGAELYTFDDKEFLTGDAINTTVAAFHIDNPVYLGLGEVEYGNVKTYDVYDLTGVASNSSKGTDSGASWDYGQLIGNINAADKENVSFKANVNIPEQKGFRLSLSALDSNACVNAEGYGLELDTEQNKLIFTRAGSWITSWNVDSSALTGEYELEFGYRDIIGNDEVIGKQVFLKKNGEVLYSYADYDNYFTGDSLGTKVALFYYGTAVQLDTTYDISYSAPTVYDIYDLTGAAYNTIEGTDVDFNGRIYADVSADHKENMAFKTKLTMGAQNVRLSLNAKDGANIYDPQGYAVYLYGADNVVEIRRNNSALKSASVASLAGTYTFEVGIVDMMWDGEIVGKHLYVKINDVVVCQYDDMNGYLTGDTLGTKIVDFHYGAAIQMDSTYTFENVYGTANVYDIYDLTGASEKSVAPWSATKIGSVAEADKEQVAVKFNMNITNDRHRYRFSVGAPEDADCTNIYGYGLEIAVEFAPEEGAEELNYVRFQRNSDWIATFDDVSDMIGDHDYEFGYRNITNAGKLIGKQVYLSVDGVDLYTYDDIDSHLTGDTLGTMAALHHIDESAVVLHTTYETTYGEVNIYNITTNDIYGTIGTSAGGNDNWSGTAFGNIDSANKENAAWKAYVTFAEQEEYRFAIGAQESSSYTDASGYRMIVNLAAAENQIILARGAGCVKSWTVADIADAANKTLPVEFGYRDIMINGQVIGKQIYVTIQDVGTFSYDDCDGYLTGDALGTVAALFHYGSLVNITPIS